MSVFLVTNNNSFSPAKVQLFFITAYFFGFLAICRLAAIVAKGGVLLIQWQLWMQNPCLFGFTLFLGFTPQNAPTYREPHISPQDRVYLTAVRYGCRMYEIWVSWEKDMAAYSFTTFRTHFRPSSSVTSTK